MPRLGINIDHIATVRNARGGAHPEPLRAALLAQIAGADGITMHLREDRRHIRDADVFAVNAQVALPLNLEMAATAEMQAIALEVRPHACCLVPEKREELTTEGGLAVAGKEAGLRAFITPLKAAGMRISLFVEPDPAQLEAAKAVGADIVELHTGRWAELYSKESEKNSPAYEGGTEAARELARLREAATHAVALGLEVHAGHGLNYDNIGPIAALPEVVELNIGHFLMGEAMFVGLNQAIQDMRTIIDPVR